MEGVMPRATKPSTADAPRRPLATPQQIAEYLGVPLGTVYQWSSRGGGPRMSRVGRHLRAKWEDLDAYLEANRVDAA
jgi:excisionase family DNA binding protein